MLRKKISLWQALLAEGDLQMLINFHENNGEKDQNRQVVSIIQQHLQSLTEFFYYPNEEDHRHGNMWIIDPFAADISKLNLNSLKAKFQSSLS